MFSKGSSINLVLRSITFYLLAIAPFALTSTVNAAGSANADEIIEEVIVTGSRIPQNSNLVSSSPVTQVGAEELIYGGIVRIEDLLNDLPQTRGNNASTDSNGAVGTSSVDLRGLGRDRTLVLLNGKRLVRGSPRQAGGGADLNQIPDLVIKKVEVLTGGASAVYGSDAIAGVVNFILDDTFEGIKFDYQFSQYQHKNNDNRIQNIVSSTGFDLPSGRVSDGDTNTYSFAYGAEINDGSGHMTLYATHRDVDPVLQSSRDYSACSLNSSNTGCGGSSTLPRGRFTDFGSIGSAKSAVIDAALETDIGTPAFRALRDPANAAMLAAEQMRIEGILNANASFAALSSFDLVTADNSNDFRTRTGDLYNFAPLNYYQRPDKRTLIGGYFNNEFSEHVEIYAEVGYGRDETQSQIAPSGAFFVTEDLFCGNPLLSAAQFQQICGQYGLTNTQFFSEVGALAGLASNPTLNIGRRNLEGGSRQDDILHTSYRAVFGVKGDIDSAWSYDVSVNFAQTDFSETYQNDLSITRITRALDVVTDANGNPVCRSVQDGSDANCVPWNVFTNNGNQIATNVRDGVTQAAIDYLTLPLFATGSTSLNQFNAFVVGDLSDYGVIIPSADSGISVSFGVEYIEETLVLTPDNGFTSGDGAGQGGPTSGVDGTLSVNEFFLETRIPLVENKTGAQSLVFDAGLRVADYSTGQDTTSFKTAVSWAIVDDFKFRASFQRASRHANIRELFAPTSIGLFDGTDPCANTTDADGNPVNPTATAAQCANTGVTAAQFGNIASSPAGQYNEVTGGNVNLAPEESDTISFGFLITPSAVPGLDISIDYYSIDLVEAIAGIGSQEILDNCIANGTPALCALINRGAGGTLWLGQDNIVNTNINTGFEERNGIDLNVNYALDIGEAGTIDIKAVATYLLAYDSQSIPGGPISDCVGRWGSICEVPNPELAANLRATWYSPYDFSISTSLRYVDSVDSDDGARPGFASQTYVDLSALYEYKFLNFRLGANNLFDRQPPIAGNPPTGNGNTYAEAYDGLGRYVFFGVGASF